MILSFFKFKSHVLFHLESIWLDSEGFDESRMLKSLQKIENHFKHFILKSDFMELFPRNILSLDITFQEAYIRVIEYHCNVIDPALESQVTNVVELCQNVQQWLRDPAFMIYQKYAYLAAIIMNYFQTGKICAGDDPEIRFIQLEPLIQAPLKHLMRYQKFFSRVMIRLSKTLNVSGNINLLKVVAETSKDFNSFANLVRENYEFKIKVRQSLHLRERFVDKIILWNSSLVSISV